MIAADVKTAAIGVFDSYNYYDNVDDQITTIDHVSASAVIHKIFDMCDKRKKDSLNKRMKDILENKVFYNDAF